MHSEKCNQNPIESFNDEFNKRSDAFVKLAANKMKQKSTDILN